MPTVFISLFASFLLYTVQTANAQCFQSSSGALCCPEVYDCASTRCIIDVGCDRGAATCVSNVCRRPGSTLPPPPPAPAPAPEPVFAPAPPPVEQEPVADMPVDNSSSDNAQMEEGMGDANSGMDAANPNSGVQDNAPVSDQPGEQNIYEDLLECDGRRTRREVRDMSDEEWNAFANALNELKNRPSRANPSTNQYEDLARIHSEFVVEAHGGSFFLPWHRLFILLLENLLRQVNPSVTLPYWNWSADAADPAMSNIWDRVGGSVRDGNGQASCIPFGPFTNMQTSHETPHCVRRGFVSYQSNSMVPFDNSITIQALIERDVPYARFAAALESTHGSPHVGLGGDMSVLGTAPNDPIFFLHHAYVDYIYQQWQNNGNGIPGRFGGTNPGVEGRVRRDSVILAFDRSVRYAQRLRCIEYAEYSGSFGLNSGTTDLHVQELPPDFIENNGLNKTRIDEGHEVLQEALDAYLNS